jgi:hypothetical protein
MHFSELKDSNEITLKRVIMRNISGEVIVSLRLGEVLVSLKYWAGIFTHREVWPFLLWWSGWLKRTDIDIES